MRLEGWNQSSCCSSFETPRFARLLSMRLGGKLEAKRLEAGCDAVGDQADLAQVAHQPVMQVAAEVLAEGGLVAAGGALAAELAQLVELGLGHSHFLVDDERER